MTQSESNKISPEIFGVYKPVGPTSHDLVDLVRRITGVGRVGHAGTLDPLARGVLVLAVGRGATKQLGQIVKKEKEYLAKIKLGFWSTTDDEEGKKEEVKISRWPSDDDLRKILIKFQGWISQKPPVFSAIKIKGKKAYELARSGELPEPKPRLVEIKEIELIDYHFPWLNLRVATGPGVYLRSLARDLGSALGTGGYLADLERTRVGQFSKDQAIRPDELKNFLISRQWVRLSE